MNNNWNEKENFFIWKHRKTILFITTGHIIICCILGLILNKLLFTLIQIGLYFIFNVGGIILANPSGYRPYSSWRLSIPWLISNFINFIFTIVYFL